MKVAQIRTNLLAPRENFMHSLKLETATISQPLVQNLKAHGVVVRDTIKEFLQDTMFKSVIIGKLGEDESTMCPLIYF